jgi:hypothetical protein
MGFQCQFIGMSLFRSGPAAWFHSSSTPVVYGDCGASSPDKKRGRRAGGGFASPAKVNAEEFYGLIADAFLDNFKRHFKAGSSHCCYENELAYKIFTLIVYRIFKMFCVFNIMYGVYLVPFCVSILKNLY